MTISGVAIISFFSSDLQSGGGHGLILVHGDQGTGDPARVPETGVTIPHALARWSAGGGRKSESDGRKAFRHPRARHLAVSHNLFMSIFIQADRHDPEMLDGGVRCCSWMTALCFRTIVSLPLILSIEYFCISKFLFTIPFLSPFQFAVQLSGWVSWTREHSSKMLPVYWRSLAR